MVICMTTNTDSAPVSKRSRVSQGDIPALSLEKARRVASAIAENYASDPTRPLDVASALNVSPTSGPFRTLCGAALGYGLTDGGPNAAAIGLTALGHRLEAPTEVGDDLADLKEAAQTPTVAAKFYAKYDGAALPPQNIAENVLVGFDVPRDRASDVYGLLIANAEYAGLIKTIKEKQYIDTSGTPVALPQASPETELIDPADAASDESEDFVAPAPLPASAPEPPRPKNSIFIGHGGKRGPMEQLVKILNEYSIPHKQAVAEANQGRPIPQKVADVMRDCGAAILVFTADREYFDKDGNSIWKPSENVSHELGAASVLYGDRIVIFKEHGIDLPSNFSSVGYIEFEPDKLEEKGIELFRELVSMKIVSISVG